ARADGRAARASGKDRAAVADHVPAQAHAGLERRCREGRRRGFPGQPVRRPARHSPDALGNPEPPRAFMSLAGPGPRGHHDVAAGKAMERPASSDLWVILAAYREAKVIAEVVADVMSTGHRVVVVDDGSPDETAGRAAQAGATVIRHPINLGQGAAPPTGPAFAPARRADVIVPFHAR